MSPHMLNHEIHTRNLTKTRAAHVLGISRNYLHAMLSGRRPIPHETADRMVERLRLYDEGRDPDGAVA